MMFSFTFMCCEYRDISLLTRVQHIHWETVSWDNSFTGSNEDLWIHPRELELSVKVSMWDPCTSLWTVIYIDVAEETKYSRFNVSTSCHLVKVCQIHAMLFSLYPLILYFRHRTIVWLLGSWKIYFLLVILDLWPIGGYLYRGGGLVCVRTGDIVGTTYYPFSEGDVVE